MVFSALHFFFAHIRFMLKQIGASGTESEATKPTSGKRVMNA